MANGRLADDHLDNSLVRSGLLVERRSRLYRWCAAVRSPDVSVQPEDEMITLLRIISGRARRHAASRAHLVARRPFLGVSDRSPAASRLKTYKPAFSESAERVRVVKQSSVAAARRIRQLPTPMSITL